MPVLQIRDVPDHIYLLLAEQAEKERRSLAQQAVAVLARGLEVELDPRGRRKQVLKRIQDGLPGVPRKLSDPVKLVRQDRQR